MDQAPAEFHDIGKIIDWRAIGLQARGLDGQPTEKEPHDFEKCTDPEWGVDFSAEVWESIFRKDPGIVAAHYPRSANWVFASIADELAAGLGRLREELISGPPSYGRHKLWTGKTEADQRLRNTTELRQLIAFLNRDPKWPEAVRSYGGLFHSRAETARPGLNVTSLHAHSILAGKLSRVVQRAAAVPDQTFPSYAEALHSLGRSKLTTLFLTLRFPQRPFRTRDLVVFGSLRKAIDQFVMQYDDNVLLRFGESILGLFSSHADADALVRAAVAQGFLAAVRVGERTLEEMRSIGIDECLGRETKVFFPELPDQIEPPLCEGCQLAHGDHRWPAEMLATRGDLTSVVRDGLRTRPWGDLRVEQFPECDHHKLVEWLELWGEETLCSRCFNLRTAGEPHRKLATWDTGTVVWVRMALDLDALDVALRALHRAHIQTSAATVSPALLEKLPVRLPLLVDFVDDYLVFLRRWRDRVCVAYGEAAVEDVTEELLCVKLSAQRDVLHLLEIHDQLMTEWFRKLLDQDPAPIRIGLSVSPAKHPFFAHWAWLAAPEDGISIQVVGGGTATIPLTQLAAVLRTIGSGERRALHRLRQIARTSKTLAQMVLSDRADRDSRSFAQLKRITTLGMDFESLVTLTNLAEH
jgi:hypothetical protein